MCQQVKNLNEKLKIIGWEQGVGLYYQKDGMMATITELINKYRLYDDNTDLIEMSKDTRHPSQR